MKRIFSTVISMGLALSLIGCTAAGGGAASTDKTSTAKADHSFTPGTYSGVALGNGGIVTVNVTVDEKAITDVSVDAPDETEGIGTLAINEIPPAIIAAQSADVDVVATATITSDAIKLAAQQAIDKAAGKEVASDGEVGFKAGTYEGKGAGYNGDVVLSVTFTDKAIEGIEVVSSNETAFVGDVAQDIIIKDIIDANGIGVDSVSGATFSSRAVKNAVIDAAKKAEVSNPTALLLNKKEVVAGETIESTHDVVIVGGGGAGIAAAAQAAQNGDSVLLIEKNAQIGGNTIVSGGQYQSVMKYLVWDEKDPDAVTGVGFDGKTYDKVKSVQGCIDELKVILNWSEKEFDDSYYKDNEYVAGDIEELSKHGVHADYLPVLQALKKEIKAYLDWAEPQLAAGKAESDLTLFSTLNLHIFQSYYGGLRVSADGSQWIYGDVDLVTQMVEEGQELKPWLNEMGATFVEDKQPTLIGALWYRENLFIGANADLDGDGKTEEYKGRWGTYFAAPMSVFLNANKENAIMTRTNATELIVEDGRVTGVKATKYDGTEVIAKAAKGVIIATGGFAANIDKVVEDNLYWSSDFLSKETKTTNRSSLRGDGIAMAKAAGAATTGEGFTQLMPISWIDNGNLAFGGGDYAIYINPSTGLRFVDETSERDVLSLAEFKNGIEFNGAKGVFIEIANAESPIPGPYPYKEEDVAYRQYVRDISELEALFKEIGFETDVDTVKATIEAYDKAIIEGRQPENAGKKQASALVGSAKRNEDGTYDESSYTLEGVKLRIRLLAPSTHHTMGGLVIDTERHVLDAEGNVIEGLYAAGEVTGGIHGGNRLGGNAIVEIFVSGRIAANAVNADNK